MDHTGEALNDTAVSDFLPEEEQMLRGTGDVDYRPENPVYARDDDDGPRTRCMLATTMMRTIRHRSTMALRHHSLCQGRWPFLPRLRVATGERGLTVAPSTSSTKCCAWDAEGPSSRRLLRASATKWRRLGGSRKHQRPLLAGNRNPS